MLTSQLKDENSLLVSNGRWLLEQIQNRVRSLGGRERVREEEKSKGNLIYTKPTASLLDIKL